MNCKRSKSDREREISYDIAYMWNQKKSYKLTYLQNRNRLIDLESELMAKGKGGKDWEFGMDKHTLLYLEWITNKDPLYCTGNSAQCYIIT